MNKEQLEKEIVELEKQKQQMIANVNACEGAIMAYRKMIVRSVNDAGMAATNGTVAEIVYNTADSKFYGCTVTSTPATWSALN